ncbi:ABC transporter permease [Streptomyces sp. NPDC051211]|uniref:ABC transporter permease n=1 Tax=Streptomyces sp. NPDC051211 TaxID=3154643 RepID=UPI00344DD746
MTGPATTEQRRRQPYDSPLPDLRPTLAHAVASEWTKLISVRSTVWTLGSLVALVVGIGGLVAVQTRSEDYVGMPFTAPAMFGLMAGQISVIVLGVLTITSEFGTGLVRTTFTAAPERHRVLTAKYLVFGAVALATVLGSVLLVSLSALILNNGPGSGRHDAREWTGAISAGLYVTLLGVLALAVGALVRHSAGGIAVMLGVVTLPPVLGAMLSVWEATSGIGSTVLNFSAPVALVQLFGVPGDASQGQPIPSDLAQLTLLVLITAAATAGSYVVVGRRDV